MKKYNVIKTNVTTGEKTVIAKDIAISNAKQRILDCFNEHFNTDYIKVCDIKKTSKKHNGTPYHDLISKDNYGNYVFSYNNFTYRIKPSQNG
jgi:hypothetical protein